jgi:hypothetical protein
MKWICNLQQAFRLPTTEGIPFVLKVGYNIYLCKQAITYKKQMEDQNYIP